MRPADIDLVVFTHLHLDHIGWNTVDKNGTPVPLFPNARHIVQRVEWDYWTQVDTNERAAVRFSGVLDQTLFKAVFEPIVTAGLLDIVEGGEHAVTREVLTVPTPGHTPGHVAVVVASGGKRADILGDAAHTPVQLSETDWSILADVDPEWARRTRHTLFDRIEAERALIARVHFPFPGLGHAGTPRRAAGLPSVGVRDVVGHEDPIHHPAA